MAPPSPSGRPHLPNPLSSSLRSAGPQSHRKSMYAGSRQTQYSSLGDALGGTPSSHPGRQSQSHMQSHFPPHDTPPTPVTTGAPVAHGSPDTRNYYSPTGMPTYGYTYTNPAGAYDAPAQYGTLPPMRTTSPPSRGQVHHQSGSFAAYPQTSYPAPDTDAAQHWDDWGQATSAQNYSPASYNSSFGGREAASPESEHRPYSSHFQPAPASSRSSDRGAVVGEIPPRERARERAAGTSGQHGPRPAVATMPPQDSYPKLMETYGQILGDLGNQRAFARSQGLPPRENIDRMLRSATTALQMFQPLTGQHLHKPGDDMKGNNQETEKKTSKARAGGQKEKESAAVPDGMKCLGCGATTTPEWRRGPLGPRTLCNACGLVYAKMIKKREREMGTAPYAANQQHPSHMQPTYEDNGFKSEDDISYGSQEPS